jgi:hypothetical protein
MLQPTIRPARSDEHDVVAQVWMESWVSTGLEDASNFLLAKLRARIPMEIGRVGACSSPTTVARCRHARSASA